ncbi:hypothetical protein GYMLUDRAFT_295341 [Collybiopsis luxurians FD-317 M1]|nr:hypothetical protein GYMLUDRAFT_295341 [Collybiopsis luxurians FD-317 M1]
MVSPIWTASSEGHLDELEQLLKNASNVDVNVKDDTGVTPLIAAVKNGHLEVIQALLAHGADPMSASNQGPPQSYTQDPVILELLISAQAKTTPPPNENGFYPESYSYYPPPPPEGAVFYPHPPPDSQSVLGPGNLPPPEIARLIPCRYFPACRYGSSCLFAHPQGPYISGPLPPPAQYPAPYDPMNPSFPPNYYPMSPPSFQPPPPNGMNPILSPANSVPVPQPSEMVQPFSPNGPPPAPYTAGSPSTPFHQPASVPMPAPPIPPTYHQPQPPHLPQQQPPMPPNVYNTSPHAPPFLVQPNGVPQYPPPPPLGYADGANKSPPLNPQPDAFTTSAPQGPPAPPREHVAHARRGSVPRGPFNSRKPPCLFYPAGRCKNGDDCRFPHILPSEYPAQFGGGRGGAPRAPRGHVHGNNHGHANGLDAKMASLSMRDLRPPNGHAIESHAKLDNNRPRIPQGSKNGANASSNNKRLPPIKQQRVPNADEFPVLGNLASPPAKSVGVNGYFNNGHTGPTAAQVLQAPAPRKDSPMANGTATSTPSDSASVKDIETKLVPQPPPTQSAAQKLPISFAAIAANGVPEAAAEVSVSA